MSYKAIGTGWPETNPTRKPYDWSNNGKVKLLSKTEVKHLVNTNQWQKLGQVFNFIPVFHFEGKNFLDWRCVPQSLLVILRDNPKQKFPSNLHQGALDNMNRVQKRKHIRQLMLKAEWGAIARIYGFRPRFVLMPNGKHVIDWTCLPWNVHEILKCGGNIKSTPYTQEGGIYDPLQKPKKEHVPRRPLIPSSERVKRLPLVERLPIRQRLYEAQKGVCYFCKQFVMLDAPAGKIGWNTDHLTPISRGGTNEESNLRGTCTDCNSNKSSMNEAEFLRSNFLKEKLNSQSTKHS